MPKTNSLGQVVGQTCKFCLRPSEECVGRCSVCKTEALWREEENLYRCNCGESVLTVLKTKGG